MIIGCWRLPSGNVATAEQTATGATVTWRDGVPSDASDLAHYRAQILPAIVKALAHRHRITRALVLTA